MSPAAAMSLAATMSLAAAMSPAAAMSLAAAKSLAAAMSLAAARPAAACAPLVPRAVSVGAPCIRLVRHSRPLASLCPCVQSVDSCPGQLRKPVCDGALKTAGGPARLDGLLIWIERLFEPPTHATLEPRSAPLRRRRLSRRRRRRLGSLIAATTAVLVAQSSPRMAHDGTFGRFGGVRHRQGATATQRPILGSAGAGDSTHS